MKRIQKYEIEPFMEFDFINNSKESDSILLLLFCSDSQVDELIFFLSSNYEINSVSENVWLEENTLENLRRLNIRQSNFRAIKDHLQTHKSFFTIFIKSRSNGYEFSLDQVEGVNITNTDSIALRKGLSDKFSNIPFYISRSIRESSYLNTLIFGLEYYDNDSYSERVSNISTVRSDTVGFNGWRDFKELFGAINLMCDYVILRNYEFLPNDFFGNDKDIDILTSDVETLVLALNAKKVGARISCYEVIVDNRRVLLDIRYPGDNYYDQSWEIAMLKNRILKDSLLYILDDPNYFFSLFYHCKIQKKYVKPIYVDRLNSLSKKSCFGLSMKSILRDDKLSVQVLDSFLKSKGYFMTIPSEKNYIDLMNIDLYKQSTRIKPEPWHRSKAAYFHRLYNKLMFIMPTFIKKLAPQKVKKYISSRMFDNV